MNFFPFSGRRAAVVALALLAGLAACKKDGASAKIDFKGRVVDARTGQPLPDVPVELGRRTGNFATGTSGRERYATARTDAAGNFSFSRDAPALPIDYYLLAGDQDFATTTTTLTDVLLSTKTSPVPQDLAVWRLQRVTVEVSGGAGLPAPTLSWNLDSTITDDAQVARSYPEGQVVSSQPAARLTDPKFVEWPSTAVPIQAQVELLVPEGRTLNLYVDPDGIPSNGKRQISVGPSPMPRTVPVRF